MASVKHSKVSADDDGPDSNQIQPSDWNDEHDVTIDWGDLGGTLSGQTDLQSALDAKQDAGVIGTFLTAARSSESPVSTTALANITSVSLPPGKWLVQGTASMKISDKTKVAIFKAGISLVSATLGADGTFSILDLVPTFFGIIALPTPVVMLDLATTTTVRLVAIATPFAGTSTGFGNINACRVG